MESSVNYQPKFGRVLIKREVSDKIGSIIVPNAKKIANCVGKIVGLGETAGWTESYDEKGERIVIQTLKIGDEVIFGRHSGAWVDSTFNPRGEQNDDGSLFICQDQDILCVLTRKEKNERISGRSAA